MPTDAIYAIQVTVAGRQACKEMPDASNFISQLDTAGLHALAPAYTEISTASLALRLNTVPVFLDYPSAGATLKLSIPALGIEKIFEGDSRGDTRKQLRSYLLFSGVLGKILNYQATHSPTSTISGPGGIIPLALMLDFFDNQRLQADALGDGALSGRFDVGLYRLEHEAAGQRIVSDVFPMTYRGAFGAAQPFRYTLSLPLVSTRVGATSAYHAIPGAALHAALSRDWEITTALRYGATWSEGMATAAWVRGFSLASRYRWQAGGGDWILTNLIGHYATLPVQLSQGEVDPHVNAGIMKHGITFQRPWLLADRTLILATTASVARHLQGGSNDDDNVGLNFSVAGKINAGYVTSWKLGIGFLRGADTRTVNLFSGLSF